jgi:hypothetical protein
VAEGFTVRQASAVAEQDLPRSTVFFDLGVSGTWADAILHSPCIDVSDYPAIEARARGSQRCAASVAGTFHEGING